MPKDVQYLPLISTPIIPAYVKRANIFSSVNFVNYCSVHVGFVALILPFGVICYSPLFILCHFIHRSKNEVETFFLKARTLITVPSFVCWSLLTYQKDCEFLGWLRPYSSFSNTDTRPLTLWLAATSHKVMKWRNHITRNTNLPDFFTFFHSKSNGVLLFITNESLSCLSFYHRTSGICKWEWMSERRGCLLWPHCSLGVVAAGQGKPPPSQLCWMLALRQCTLLTLSQPAHLHLQSKLLFRIV